MGLTDSQVATLKLKAQQIRRKTIETVVWAGGGHLGGALSQVEIMVLLYYHFLNIDPKRPDWADRDRVVLSKGHGGIGYAPLLADRGYFSEGLLEEFNHTGSPFGMHLDRLKVPGVDASTGSLGHGLPMAVGMALGARLKGAAWRTYCILGDGECNEGSVWEAAMAAAHFRLDTLTALIDRNGLCIDGTTEAIMALEPLADKWRAFGWEVTAVDGHDFRELAGAIEAARRSTGRPTAIIARTVKGKGVDFMEDQAAWHYGGLDSERAALALQSIDRRSDTAGPGRRAP
ncbi:MAG TPA: transketolase [Clostridiales bacterium]|nr:transketolase [Clostridiales bacterium]